MWSDNKKVSAIVNILIFLTACNFLYYGQLLLPLICLVLFIDNKFKFKVRNKIGFILICLFSISFFVFSKKDFYCVMGFTLPMAYYIGSNIKEVDEDNIKKLLRVICLGFAAHILLNFVSDLTINGMEAFRMVSRYDFWYRDTVPPTIIAVLYTIPIGCLYYLIFNEKDKKIKVFGLVIFFLMMIYEVMLGRRTPILMLIIALILPMLMSLLLFGEKMIHKEIFGVVGVIVVLIVIISYFIKDDGSRLFMAIREIPLIYKFLTFKFDPERIETVIAAFNVLPNHLWGGQEISTILDTQIHEFWLDIMDYSGIVSYILMVIYSIYNFVSMFKVYKNNHLSKDFKMLMINVFVCIIMQMFLEPLMTNSSIFLICTIILLESAYCLNKN